MSKKIFILFGFLFLTILFLGIVSADMCWVEATSADCVTNNGEIVMDLSGSTNAHGALAGQGIFAPVLCCDFGEGDTSCTADNKIIGLSSSTNAHAEAPDLVSPDYNNVGVCYDSLKDCSSIDAGLNCAVGEIEVVYISNLTNAHIEEAGLQSQNYNSKVCCVVELPPAPCVLTSAEWQYEEVFEGTDAGAIVNGTDCGGETISFEVFRGSTSCDSIAGCENPPNEVFISGSNSVTGTWNASPYHSNEYRFVASVVANPSETEPSITPNLLVKDFDLDCSSIAICNQYEIDSNCNSNLCGIDVQDSVPNDVDCSDSEINCECVWDDNECKSSWGSSPPGSCGNGVINTGETCDGASWGNILGCSDFDVFTGGDLDCYAPGASNECQFDTSSCTEGTGGYCGNNIIDAGETCDGSEFGTLVCTDFDVFTGGSLSCVDCSIDTSSCTGGTIGVCNDGDINTGEQCDGTTWDPITSCSDFGTFTSGSLSCGIDCNFDTSLCTGGTGGYCGNDIIDAGETCDGSSGWLPITDCSNFDYFTGGTLICAGCQFDTSQCTGGLGASEVGTCIYTQFTDDNCDDGFLTFNWTAEWTWDDGCPLGSQCQIDNLALEAECDNGHRSVECPAQIPLPFFNMYSFIATLTIIAMIYVILILRKEKRKR